MKSYIIFVTHFKSDKIIFTSWQIMAVKSMIFKNILLLVLTITGFTDFM